MSIEQSDAHSVTPSGLEAGVQIGDFRIEKRLGAGGMGIVYQARQISLNRPVALKVLGPALTRGIDATRFQREAQAAARLHHESIARVYFIGQDRQVCYMAMELVDGISLRTVLDRLRTTNSLETSIDTAVREDPAIAPELDAIRFDLATETMPEQLDVPETLHYEKPPEKSDSGLSPKARALRNHQSHIRRSAELIREAAEALAHAHEQKVIHRDIKPDNLLIDRKGKLHLIDFGIARFFEDQAVTYTGQLVGTPLYMSPEQVTARGSIDCRTDIYSLGLVLYELLTLRPPLEAVNREILLRNIITKPLPPVSWRNSAVPEALIRIVHRATQKDPDQRYNSASEMAADLTNFLCGKSVLAPPYHFRLDEGEIIASRPGGIVLAAFILCLVAVGVSLALVSIGLMTLMMNSSEETRTSVFVVEISIAAGVLSGGILVSRGLLSGRPWARWTGLILLALICIGSMVGIATLGIQCLRYSSESISNPQITSAENANASAETARNNRPFNERNLMFGMAVFYAFPLLVTLVLSAAGFGTIVLRRTTEWFALAKQIRNEHRGMKERLD